MHHSAAQYQREREMSNNHRFKLSHLMPNSWFYKLRDMKTPRPPSQRSSKRSNHYYHGTTTPKPLPLSPHQFYPYSKTNKEMPLAKLRPSSSLHLNPKATDIQFTLNHYQHLHEYHQSPISRTSAAVEGDHDELQDLQLPPIRTTIPQSTGSASARSAISIGGTCPSSPKLRSRRLHITNTGKVSTTGANGRRSAARRSFAVVKASMDPRTDFRESMVEIIAENKVDDLEELLECYLSLNSWEYHGGVQGSFARDCR
jgi:uncharacterized protein (TIGR01568 family)